MNSGTSTPQPKLISTQTHHHLRGAEEHHLSKCTENNKIPTAVNGQLQFELDCDETHLAQNT